MTIDPPATGQSFEALMTGAFSDRERALVETMMLAIRERAERTERAEAERTERINQAERSFSHAMHSETQKHESDREAITAKLERSLRKLEERFEERKKEIEREYQSKRIAVIERLNKQERAIDEDFKEAVWLAETVFDAEDAKPRLLYERVSRSLDSARTRAIEIENAALAIARSHMRAEDRSAGLSEEPVVCEDPDENLSRIGALLEEAQFGVKGLQRATLLKVAGGVLFLSPLILLGVAIGAGFASGWTGWKVPVGAAGAALLLIVGVFFILRHLGSGQMRRAFIPVQSKLAEARALMDATHSSVEASTSFQRAELAEKKRADSIAAREEQRQARADVESRRLNEIEKVDFEFKPRLAAWHDKFVQDRERIRGEAAARIDELDAAFAEVSDKLKSEYEESLAEAERRYETERVESERDWFERMAAVREAGTDMADRAAAYFPEWSDSSWEEYHPPASATPAIRFGSIVADGSTFEGGLPEDPRLLENIVSRYELPAMLDFPGACSLLIETGPENRELGIATLQNLMLRLLTSIPPGKLRFTIIDPVGLGQSFSGFMHLADYQESLVSNRIWTDPKHIEQRLTDLTEHMEKVIQKYLRNEFESIELYNEAAGEIAEPYRFLVIADFPTSFTDAAAQRLKSILESGARCGVYTLVLTDPAQKLPSNLTLEDIERHAVTVIEKDGELRMADDVLGQLPLSLESPPPDAFVSRIVHRVGELSKDAGRVEVPFRIIAPTPDKIWSWSCSDELRVPLGRVGATKQQFLALGHGTSQHVLLAGKTGSGKSTLLHVLIASMALWYSPEEVELYLVDFKKGVEFKTYATHQLAHARAVAVESDREFGLSVLHKLDEELKRRGDLYREVGAQDIAGFRARRPDIHMPRTLLMIDEFQEFFVDDDKIGQEASLLLDRLVRQGRAFGMHVMLGSQTLSGAYSLARSTMGQMAVRIALQCSETDSYLILSEDNAAARLLARPGEAIYNDANGMIEGNSPFQIAWLPDSVRDIALETVRERVKQSGYEPPEPQIVFEGNIPARLEENHEIAALAESRPEVMPLSARAWLGDPVAIKEPTAIVFRRHTGSHAIMVGQQDDPTLAIMISSLVSLASQFPVNAARFTVLDGTPADDPRAGTLESVAGFMPHETRFGSWRDAESVLEGLGAELTRREAGNLTDETTEFVLIHGLHRFRGLRRKEDDYSFGADTEPETPDKILARLIREGSGLGMHVLLWVDTVSNLERGLDRQTIGQIDTRVLFQMNAADSTTLIDSPAAGRLGMQRALLYREESGELEKFRPYAMPDLEWVRGVLAKIARQTG